MPSIASFAECDERCLRMGVVQGGAASSDAMARTWARLNDVHLVNQPAAWDQHTPDLCLAIVRRCDGADPVRTDLKPARRGGPRRWGQLLPIRRSSGRPGPDAHVHVETSAR